MCLFRLKYPKQEKGESRGGSFVGLSQEKKKDVAT